VHQIGRAAVLLCRVTEKTISSPLEPVLLEQSWVGRATVTAKRVVMVAYGLVTIFVALLFFERFSFIDGNEVGMEKVKNAIAVSSEIMLEDERLTMLANLAAASGDRIWVERYEAQIPIMDAAIAAAMSLAPAEIAQKFDSATRVANDKLVELERQAFASIAANNLEKARLILNSAKYSENKAILAKGTDAFTKELQAAVELQLSVIKKRSWAIAILLLVIGLGSFSFLWRILDFHLNEAQAALSEKQAEVTQLALSDTLTGLANRRHLLLLLEHRMALVQREGGLIALLMIDLDGFKAINDQFGHSCGDTVLVEIGKRLQFRLRKTDIIARLGGDEFVVAFNLPAELHFERSQIAADGIIEELSKTFVIDVAQVNVGASVGVAFYPEDASLAEELIRKADVALYRSKNEGKGIVRFFNPRMEPESDKVGKSTNKYAIR
jgi:diguanylate cyclase (GGDEF)-like protein